jgi:hypothetical protein
MQPYERVATTIDEADGAGFVVRLVLTAKSEQALQNAEPTFLAMLGGF